MDLSDTDIEYYRDLDGVAVDRAGNLRGVYRTDGTLHPVVRDDAFFERARELQLRACTSAIAAVGRQRFPLIHTRIDLRRVTTWRQVLSRPGVVYWAYKGPSFRYSRPAQDVEVCIIIHSSTTEADSKPHPKRKSRRTPAQAAQGYLLARYADGSNFQAKSPVFARRHSKSAVLTWLMRRLRTTQSFLAEVVMVAAAMHRTAV